MIAKVPALTSLYLQIGGLYRTQKQYDKAIETYKRVPAGDTNADKAQIEIGMTLLEKNDLAGAEAALMPMAQSTSASKEVFYNLGEVKFAKGETDEAVKYYTRASEMDPNWGKPMFKLGLAKLQKGDTAGTLEIMTKLVQVDPNSQEAAQAKALIEQLKK
jgi:tetratricopeptide (TPR) repeat protein